MSDIKYPDAPLVSVWQWRVPEPGPALVASLRVGEAVRGAVTRQYLAATGRLLPDDVHRHDRQAHGHALWLPFDFDEDGLIDRVMVYRAGGLPPAVLSALAATDQFTLDGFRYRMDAEVMGPADLASWLTGPARVWQSATPFVTPNWRLTKTGRERAEFTPDKQLLSEIAGRGFSEPASVEWQPMRWLGEELVAASDFAMVRARATDPKRARPPGDAVAAFATIAFLEPVFGPITVGYGAHFGLGLFHPIQ